LRAPAWISTTGGDGGVPLRAGLRRVLSIAGSQLNFKVIDFSPLSFCSLAVRYSQKPLQALAGGNRLRRVHVGIIPSFEKGGRATLAM
jgi:hypothetical protein